MKVFVYSKKDNRTIATFNHVSDVHFDEMMGVIQITDEIGKVHTYNRKVVKTRIYQN